MKKGQKASLETKMKMSLAQKLIGSQPSFKGHKHSELTKIKIGQFHKGKKISEEYKEVLRKKMKGNTFNKGKKHSKETRKKISETKIPVKNAAEKINNARLE